MGKTIRNKIAGLLAAVSTCGFLMNGVSKVSAMDNQVSQNAKEKEKIEIIESSREAADLTEKEKDSLLLCMSGIIGSTGGRHVSIDDKALLGEIRSNRFSSYDDGFVRVITETYKSENYIKYWFYPLGKSKHFAVFCWDKRYDFWVPFYMSGRLLIVSEKQKELMKSIINGTDVNEFMEKMGEDFVNEAKRNKGKAEIIESDLLYGRLIYNDSIYRHKMVNINSKKWIDDNNLPTKTWSNETLVEYARKKCEKMRNKPLKFCFFPLRSDNFALLRWSNTKWGWLNVPGIMRESTNEIDHDHTDKVLVVTKGQKELFESVFNGDYYKNHNLILTDENNGTSFVVKSKGYGVASAFLPIAMSVGCCGVESISRFFF